MQERTLIIVKPDAIQRHLAGEIISRFEKKGFKLVAAKFMQISKALAEQHYAAHRGKPFFEPVVKYLSSSPSLVMVWEADKVIEMARTLMGPTFSFEAPAGTIRGDLSSSGRYNLVHGSDSPESARYEIDLYFKPEEMVSYKLADEDWLYCKTVQC